MLQTKVLTRSSFGDNFDLVIRLHRLRARVFKDRLDWEVSVAGDMEMDGYDTCDPIHLLVVTPAREVVGSVRLLPTTGPNMLADTFPVLLDGGPAPCDAAILESSRFCVDTERSADLASAGLRHATMLLFQAMLETGLEQGATAIATVTDARMERILRRAGWPLERLGAPHQIGSTQAVAGLLPVCRDALANIRRAAGAHADEHPVSSPIALAA